MRIILDDGINAPGKQSTRPSCSEEDRHSIQCRPYRRAADHQKQSSCFLGSFGSRSSRRKPSAQGTLDHMWYVITGAIIIWALYNYIKKKKSKTSIPLSTHVDNGGWEEAKKQKAQSLSNLKESFQPAQDNEAAFQKGKAALNEFLAHHHQSPDVINAKFQNLNLPHDLVKKEQALRKELNKHYKNREDLNSKAFAIFLAYEHAKFLLEHPNVEWKNFAGLQKLQSNWKAEEYFDALLVLMHAFQNTFPNSSNADNLSKNIERTFELWNSRKIAQTTYEKNVKSFQKAKTASDKHFIILDIIGYLDRRFKFNPQHRGELVDWCHKDVELYEKFLTEFHEHNFFTIDDQMQFMDNPALKQKKLSAVSFDHVKRLKNYLVPRLNSYDVLVKIYEQENNSDKLNWLRNIGQHIGYGERGNPPQEEETSAESLDIPAITRTIEIPKSGRKGKLAFLNSSGEACSTEDAFKDNAEQSGLCVMRAEVSFWQAMFCLTFWEEIFGEIGQPIQGQDIPHDLFQGEAFYFNRQQQIDLKYQSLKQKNLLDFINHQIEKTAGAWTRLVFNGDQDMIAYSKSQIVQDFLRRIDSETFAKIVYRIAQNPNENRSGVSDFVVWNHDTLKMVEVKKVREKIRDSQKSWLAWMRNKNIPAEIVRVKGV